MGLSGSGKTTLATKIKDDLNADYHNADIVRNQYDDWDFSKEGRVRQAERFGELARHSDNEYVVLDFICPLEQCRNVIKADYIIWMDTVKSSEYKDTDAVFEIPLKSADTIISNLSYNVNTLSKIIRTMK